MGNSILTTVSINNLKKRQILMILYICFDRIFRFFGAGHLEVLLFGLPSLLPPCGLFLVSATLIAACFA